MRTDDRRFGARIAFLDDNTLLVQQTKFSRNRGQYVIHSDEEGFHIERHVKMASDEEIAEAVRLAVYGRLAKSAKVG